MTLKSEIKQKKPFRSREHEAALALLRTADGVRRRIAAAVAPQGLSFEQFNILRILRGVAPQGLPTLEVSARLVEQAPAITRMTEKLESKGLLRRERSQEDRRQVFCFITRKGLDALNENDDAVEEAHRTGFERLSKPQLKELLRLLATMREVDM